MEYRVYIEVKRDETVDQCTSKEYTFSLQDEKWKDVHTFEVKTSFSLDNLHVCISTEETNIPDAVLSIIIHNVRRIVEIHCKGLNISDKCYITTKQGNFTSVSADEKLCMTMHRLSTKFVFNISNSCMADLRLWDMVTASFFRVF